MRKAQFWILMFVALCMGVITGFQLCTGDADSAFAQFIGRDIE